ncbi:nicotinate-nucleotide--dimethylbenzimidazole phosphoribosyltransferase [Sphingobium terrigena]|uniref:Nicotinate-nucleotide--dimethylbenzimidazole phosphoribosyltransferase n=1 Tax=Sphingobium terrigena TaxID=2304063 RepID=A0A418YVD2_9SPHN|nr:nicotinate-nucleotide--dimethylbenzimidazole phosphoribosyltransferase [Sphingobium terrigena]RJG56187.1 nicotinate-nucleotide--dimethylbenzimidazole phosphoribosyltransferase [Sphingobium terrigena]
MRYFASPGAFDMALRTLPEAQPASIAAAAERQAHLTKPAGSLGRLEEIALFFAGWQGTPRPLIDHARAVIFAGNHGVTVHGVSAFPASVTAAMVDNFRNGGGAINALAQAAGMDVDIVALDLDRPTADFTVDAAMDEADCLAALQAGAAAVDTGLHLLIVGEMGIGNSTAASALCARSLGGSAADWVGPGTGMDQAGIDRKIAVVNRALTHHTDAAHTPFETLRRLGGREIAAIAGAVVQARHLSIPVVLDGFISCAAVAPLAASFPAITDHLIAGHMSAEPGHRRLLERLGLPPLLSLDMRLGEGSGAALAVGIIRGALAAHNGMATFAEAGVAGRE